MLDFASVEKFHQQGNRTVRLPLATFNHFDLAFADAQERGKPGLCEAEPVADGAESCGGHSVLPKHTVGALDNLSVVLSLGVSFPQFGSPFVIADFVAPAIGENESGEIANAGVAQDRHWPLSTPCAHVVIDGGFGFPVGDAIAGKGDPLREGDAGEKAFVLLGDFPSSSFVSGGQDGDGFVQGLGHGLSPLDDPLYRTECDPSTGKERTCENNFTSPGADQ